MTQDAPLDQSALAAARKRIERMIHANGFYGHKITISSPPDRNGNSPVTATTLATEIVTSYLDALSRRVPASGGEQQWLIEFASKSGALSWWSLTDTQGEGGYDTDDSRKALRFARREDAQAYIDDAGWNTARPMPFGVPASPIVAAPEGWVTVPSEPTPEMLRDGDIALDRELFLRGPNSANNSRATQASLAEAYRAMLAAAPSLPEGKAEPGEAAVIERCRQVVLSHIAGMSGLDGLLHMIADEIQALSTPEPSHE